jgi:outer membrane biosynthesis protein TonB
MPLPQLRRVRWAVRATLTLGVAASVAANILHAQPNPISQVIAAWPPLALLLTVELISRVPVHRRSLAAVRLVATATIAGIAAWVSYWHMVGVAAHYGETGPSPYLLPLSVDGLVIVASVSLVELAGRIRAVEGATEVGAVKPVAVSSPVSEPAPVDVPPVDVPPVDVPPVAVAEPVAAAEPLAAAEALPVLAADGRPERAPARRPSQPRTAKAAPAKVAATKAAPRKTAAAKATTPAAAALSVAEMAALAAQLKADRPDLTQAAIAAELGITTQRLSQINRQVVAA